jgi:hypothetical protein
MALAALATPLEPSERDQVFHEALETAVGIKDPEARESAKRVVVPVVVELGSIPLAIEAAQLVPKASWFRVLGLKAFCTLIRRSTEPDLPAKALRAARAEGEEWVQVEVLVAVAPHLTPPLVLEALAGARAMKYEWRRAHALAALAAQLPPLERDQVLRESLEVLAGIKFDWRKAVALSQMARYLCPPSLAVGLEIAKALENEGRDLALSALIYRLAELGSSTTALSDLPAIRAEWRRAETLVTLGTHLPMRLLADATEAARSLRNESDRAEAQTKLARFLSPTMRDQVLREALVAVRRIRDGGQRAQTLSALVLRPTGPHYHADTQEAATEPSMSHDPLKDADQIRREALAVMCNLTDRWQRAEALTSLAPDLATLTVEEFSCLWKEVTLAMIERSREDTLSDIRCLAPVIIALGGSKAVEETCRAIEDVGRWWP